MVYPTLLAEGKTVRAAASELGINPSTVRRAKKAAIYEQAFSNTPA
ncbi:helix-turn-helix domain-containing protein [Pseudomonas sp. Rh2]